MENNKVANANFDGERERVLSSQAGQCCASAVEMLAEVCTRIMQRTNDAAACLGAIGPHNQAIGTIHDLDVELQDALALYRVAINLHRRAA